jgi:hypothetical protein
MKGFQDPRMGRNIQVRLKASKNRVFLEVFAFYVELQYITSR